ncbi:hypothetical protein [Enterococcus sp. S86.2]|uniref:hypothetical protein n=1 Tax=Enterococcus sp. S86.2 TaxID=3031299 RepID=UPI0026ECE4E1|nr:hypothetical protein [Enterococcus sp. S86.2]
MNEINEQSLQGKYTFFTESGSTYILIIDENRKVWLERKNENSDLSLRRDNEKLYVQEIVRLQVGLSAVFVLEPLGKGEVTTRITSKVLEIV